MIEYHVLLVIIDQIVHPFQKQVQCPAGYLLFRRCFPLVMELVVMLEYALLDLIVLLEQISLDYVLQESIVQQQDSKFQLAIEQPDIIA